MDKTDKVIWKNEKLEKAEENISKNEWDVDSWLLLVREAQVRPISEVRPFFERLVEQFPTSGRYWKLYIEMEMRGRNFERVEKLFQRCLMKLLYIDLWKLYVTYVKETKFSLPTYMEKMAQAYDFAIDKVGMDVTTYSIWNDYLAFLKGVNALGNYAENQKITAIRKVYQRVISVPIVNVEDLWKEYLAFEQNINTAFADKVMMERSRDYMTARRVAKELEQIIRGLNRNHHSTPPTGSPEEVKQVEQWRRYINFEKSNPLNSGDTVLVTKRVLFAYEQCLLCMGHHPDFWYEAAQYLDKSSKILTEKGDLNNATTFAAEASAIFDRAIKTTLSKSMLMCFSYADYEEGRMKYDKVHDIYLDYLGKPDVDPTLAYIQYMKFARRVEGVKSARAIFKKAREDLRTTYHIYVASALMEYYSSKDKNIAFRVFELGMKKYSQSAGYLMAYIDYLSHLNEDNNTRVLFERILSGRLEPKDSIAIWNQFLEFEANIGDLNSVVKLEQRRVAIIEQITGSEPRETAQVIDRYKYLDLYPCSALELRSIGYNSALQNMSKAQTSIAGGFLDSNEPTENLQLVLPKPDVSQMRPYKPRKKIYKGAHAFPGGQFAAPPTAGSLMAKMPPPKSFHGPFVAVNLLMEILYNIDLSNFAPRPNESSVRDKAFVEARNLRGSLITKSEIDRTLHRAKRLMIKKENKDGGGDSAGIALKLESANMIGNQKTKNDNSDSENESSVRPPLNDVYRIRQIKRLKSQME